MCAYYWSGVKLRSKFRYGRIFFSAVSTEVESYANDGLIVRVTVGEIDLRLLSRVEHNS
jgi:hypothetical protein